MSLCTGLSSEASTDASRSAMIEPGSHSHNHGDQPCDDRARQDAPEAVANDGRSVVARTARLWLRVVVVEVPGEPAGLSRSRQVRELAIAGARHIAEEPLSEERRTMLLEGLAESFMKPETAGIDWDLLRDGKRRAWPVR
jgi:hypothetical protein